MNAVLMLAGELSSLVDEAVSEVVTWFQNDVRRATEAILTTQQAVDQLHQQMLSTGFQNNEEEITFFKTIHPHFFGALLFQRLLIKMSFPQLPDAGSTTTSPKEQEKGKFEIYISRHQEFYRYYRLGLTYLDENYFLRSSTEANILFDEEDLFVDRKLFTRVSLLFARFKAYELFLRWFEAGNEAMQPQRDADKSGLNWTAQKVQLAELIYALDAIKAFGNQHTKAIADAISSQWNIHLSAIHKTFEEIRLRKKNRTPFLDLLKSALVKRMEDDDDK